VVCQWLRDAGVDHDVALPPGVPGGVDWRAVDPAHYSHLAFVCGPFLETWPIPEFLDRLKGLKLLGLNLSMVEPEGRRFHLLLERDGPRSARPDLAFAGASAAVPVVGIVLADHQPEYGNRGMHAEAAGLVRELIASRAMSAVPVDTGLASGALGPSPYPRPPAPPGQDGLVRLLLRHGARLAGEVLPSGPRGLARRLASILAPRENNAGLRTAAEVEALLARMDVVVTTRLHGLVLALKNGVPALALDPIRGGAKMARQAATLGWPHVLAVEEADAASMASAFERCLTPEARELAAACARRGREGVNAVRDRLLAEWRTAGPP
jgi:hypothetical protein